MNRRKTEKYTIWIARSGREPIVLSLRPLVILTAVGLPVSLIGAVVFFFMQHNHQLSQRNSQLTEEAGSILQQIEALETTLINLQERAKISQEADESGEDITLDAEGNVQEETGIENIGEDQEKEFDDSEYESDENFGTSNYSQYFNTSGGKGGATGAEGLLAVARAKLPNLVRELKGEVEPALQEIIVREEAKPTGAPLTSKEVEITSDFGFRGNPFGWGYELHQGIDFVAPYGAPVRATASGTVTKAEWEPGYGNHVVVAHGYGLETLYAHLSEIKVKGGDRIDRYHIIGELGNTGRSSGPHLHYGVFHNGQAVDPKKYLD